MKAVASAETPLAQRRVMPKPGTLLVTVAALACLAALAVVVTDSRSSRPTMLLDEPELYMNQYQGQVLSAGPPAPCTSLAGCGVSQPNYENPASAPNYNSAEGMTYMPSTSSGVSAEDQSPEIPAYFLDEEAKSEKRMKRCVGECCIAGRTDCCSGASGGVLGCVTLGSRRESDRRSCARF
eukprot:1624959-Rhodomonas_salina.1